MLKNNLKLQSILQKLEGIGLTIEYACCKACSKQAMRRRALHAEHSEQASSPPQAGLT